MCRHGNGGPIGGILMRSLVFRPRSTSICLTLPLRRRGTTEATPRGNAADVDDVPSVIHHALQSARLMAWIRDRRDGVLYRRSKGRRWTARKHRLCPDGAGHCQERAGRARFRPARSVSGQAAAEVRDMRIRPSDEAMAEFEEPGTGNPYPPEPDPHPPAAAGTSRSTRPTLAGILRIARFPSRPPRPRLSNSPNSRARRPPACPAPAHPTGRAPTRCRRRPDR